MNARKRIILASAVAALSLSTAGLPAQNTSGSVRSSDTDLKGSTHLDRAHDTAANVDQQTPINKANKASSLIGMDVRNAQNEKLGEIKDLVVDLHSGKIAYAVLSVGGFLGIGDKYIAVPSAAFSVAPDQERVVLNADKAKIENAPSFAKSSWPDMNSPSWRSDANYWLGESTAVGTVGSTRTGSGSDLSGSAKDNVRPKVHVDSGTATATQFRGRITAINPETRTMTVEGPSGSRQFKFGEHPTITLKDSRNPGLSDLKVGYPVVVGYHEENGAFVAHSVIRSDAPEVK